MSNNDGEAKDYPTITYQRRKEVSWTIQPQPKTRRYPTFCFLCNQLRTFLDERIGERRKAA
jgi:hypothetical protein